ncbi:MAG: molybdenum cofactor guanylyltransferase [Chloroflexi bacterium]|nr:molybdenum cofactor guanylyltransferase [Chloroflexota bacterium]
MGVSAIVLAGGLSRRLGRDKALEPFEGEPLIQRVIGRLSRFTDETVVVVNSEARGKELPLPHDAVIAVDIFPDSGSLGGIFTGLTAARNEWGFVVACDMPFLNTDLILHMLALRSDYDAVVPLLNGYPEPTHAVYSSACLPDIQRRLEARELKIAGFFDDVRVRTLSEVEVDDLDPERLSFFNVNTPEDLARAVTLAEEGR